MYRAVSLIFSISLVLVSAIATAQVQPGNTGRASGNQDVSGRDEDKKTSAHDAVFDDILGRWCVAGLGNFNTFSRDQLLVQFPNGNSRTFGILRTEVTGNRIHIYWTIKANADTVYDISDDRRTLIQVPNSSGDMGPRLELHRC
jgi:hypothetical protein